MKVAMFLLIAIEMTSFLDGFPLLYLYLPARVKGRIFEAQQDVAFPVVRVEELAIHQVFVVQEVIALNHR